MYFDSLGLTNILLTFVVLVNLAIIVTLLRILRKS